MSPSLRDEYEKIRELVADGKNTAVQLQETLSRVRNADPGVSKEDKRLLLRAIGFAGGAMECFDIILEKVDQATTQPQTLKELTRWRK
ncbi:hypothetical protein [uncultured Actinomyces sp.]|uniref:hypothetical protein n=1 Tax=uncultured Actinomyces sp. TaxID=249061 RepID=UPI00260DBEEF|nr:hypothetical protein [uncultured Actinomyces sp.]